MSVGRFLVYFIALSACSTIAFASYLVGHAGNLDAMQAEAAQPPAVSAPAGAARHKTFHKHTLVAFAD